jgi:hypothetical protein
MAWMMDEYEVLVGEHHPRYAGNHPLGDRKGGRRHPRGGFMLCGKRTGAEIDLKGKTMTIRIRQRRAVRALLAMRSGVDSWPPPFKDQQPRAGPPSRWSDTS